GARPMFRTAACVIACLLLSAPALADSAKALQAARPDLFDAKSGFRLGKYRAPSPDDIPLPAQVVGARDVQTLLDQGALAIDVYGAGQDARIDEDSGAWLISRVRDTLPGAFWLPEVGRGAVSDAMARYLEITLERLSGGNRDETIIVFCRADCWMSWNAAQRVASLGYSNVRWFKNGTDGWLDIGGALTRAEPLPVVLD
ncbi:MAG: rhodanese-like domain-containing protein, partial [Pseudomonadota bacterium]